MMCSAVLVLLHLVKVGWARGLEVVCLCLVPRVVVDDFLVKLLVVGFKAGGGRAKLFLGASCSVALELIDAVGEVLAVMGPSGAGKYPYWGSNPGLALSPTLLSYSIAH